MSSFISRIVVAVVLLPVVLGAAYLGGWWMFALISLAGLLALHEFWLLAREHAPLALAGYAGVALALVGAELSGFQWMVGGVLVTLPLAFSLKLVSRARQASTAAVSTTVLGAAWIGLGLAFLVLLRAVPDKGRLLLFTVLIAVWAGDTLAYLGGRLLGRHKMAPSTSPGKTWEGFVFGTAATVFVAFVALYKQHYLTIGQSIVLGVVLAVAAPLGDLFESLMKRDAGVKDSGRLLGGHGGMLDRLDAFLFAAPAAYFAILALT
ncbi:MAG TPA: CDP-archaeol synthase [Gaiellaceae bacterium]